ncbi:hypothetical protein HII31_09259 [Pseudocercospora fuligena]|uniref:Lipocalin-like domain-containing protein n=1 Tax=Pseudocercospora fuligena TaxID=685502 RepID=A0A8H6RD51_9PEZI|nr:hypothetical protein HII31_09259 [Pseudocercospora fuligena]
MTSLTERLPGTYRLESYVSHPTSDSKIQRVTYPMSKNVTGIIMYSQDGYMSAQLQMPGQKNFSPDSDQSWAEAGKRFFAYSGPYYITIENGEEVLRHSFELCLTPDRMGELELRSCELREDDSVLILGGKETVTLKGDERVPVLQWRRVVNNAGASLPPSQ